MHQILLDKVLRMLGNPAWVDRVMEFAYEMVPTLTGQAMTDPRELKGLLDGRDRLLDYSYPPGGVTSRGDREKRGRGQGTK
jgi:hypothetical protein